MFQPPESAPPHRLADGTVRLLMTSLAVVEIFRGLHVRVNHARHAENGVTGAIRLFQTADGEDAMASEEDAARLHPYQPDASLKATMSRAVEFSHPGAMAIIKDFARADLLHWA